MGASVGSATRPPHWLSRGYASPRIIPLALTNTRSHRLSIPHASRVLTPLCNSYGHYRIIYIPVITLISFSQQYLVLNSMHGPPPLRLVRWPSAAEDTYQQSLPQSPLMLTTLVTILTREQTRARLPRVTCRVGTLQARG